MSSKARVFGLWIVLIGALTIFHSCTKQEGCIDPNAVNYVYEAQKNDGSCLYAMCFYLNSGVQGEVDIYVDDAYVGYLDRYWASGKPSCGIDTLREFGISVVLNVPLKAGPHNVKVFALDGTIWEQDYTLPENCMRVLISSPGS